MAAGRMIFPGFEQRCIACGGTFVFLAHARTGLLAAVDRDPRPGGPIDVDMASSSFVEASPAPHGAVERGTFHATTCPGYKLRPA